MQDFKKLRVWHRAQDACVRIYKLTSDFPMEERYGLTSQLRRAAVSVGANVAEGAKRRGVSEKARFWNVAQASAAEVVSELDVAARLMFSSPAAVTDLSREYDAIAAMLGALIARTVKRKG